MPDRWLDEIEKAYQSWTHRPRHLGNYALETCKWCAGGGRKGNVASGVCSGEGSVEVIQPARECSHCGGSGRVAKRLTACWDCGGSGWTNSRAPGKKVGKK